VDDSPAELAKKIMDADRESAPIDKKLRFQWNVPLGVTPHVPFWFSVLFLVLAVLVLIDGLTG
jgi:hypothetical protein